MPPKYILVGATRWLRLLTTSSPESAMAIFMASPEFSDLTFSNYKESYEWLEEHGLLPTGESKDALLLEAAFLASIGDEDLTWLRDGIVGLPSPDFLPEPVLAAAAALGVDGMTAWRLSLQQGGKVDLEKRNRIGLLGELALIKYLEQAGVRTEHVSLRSDGLGWDILGTYKGEEWHLEAKSTTSFGRLRIYLSRHEFEISQRDSRWRLVVALINEEGDLLRCANIDANVINQRVPSDPGPLGRWQSCSIDFTGSDISTGLPKPLGGLEDSPALAATVEPAWWPMNDEPTQAALNRGWKESDDAPEA